MRQEVGVARDFAVGFYRSKRWRSVQARYMALPVGTARGTCPPRMCERCFELTGQLVPAEMVHHKVHIEPWNVDDPSVTLSFDNLMRVCRDCHAKLHYGEGYEQRVAFDEDGRVVPLGEGGQVL